MEIIWLHPTAVLALIYCVLMDQTNQSFLVIPYKISPGAVEENVFLLDRVNQVKKQGQTFWVGKIAHAHEKVTGFISWVPKSLHMVSADKPRQHIKKQTHHIADKGPCSQSYCFSRSHAWM